MAKYLKPQTPLQHQSGDYIYPITTVDQVITAKGERLNANLISVDLNESVESDTNINLVNNKPKAGFIYPLASNVVPEGFLLCDGAEYLRAEYPELFAAIGTVYGNGDGSTTFNVPNLQNNNVVNYIIATGKDTGVSVTDIITGAQVLPLGVEYGGTGATNAETARVNLGITPENIGAVNTNNVVNNFTTTEEGFAADARALKVLNDRTLQNNTYVVQKDTYYSGGSIVINVKVKNDGKEYKIPISIYGVDNNTPCFGCVSVILVPSGGIYVKGFLYELFVVDMTQITSKILQCTGTINEDSVTLTISGFDLYGRYIFSCHDYIIE